jgi:hypothetical protein
MFVRGKSDVIAVIRGCSDLRERASLDTRRMYLDRDCFRSSWLWFVNYRRVELRNPGAMAEAALGPGAEHGLKSIRLVVTGGARVSCESCRTYQLMLGA